LPGEAGNLVFKVSWGLCLRFLGDDRLPGGPWILSSKAWVRCGILFSKRPFIIGMRSSSGRGQGVDPARGFFVSIVFASRVAEK
jgi:hypothetical protein